MCSYTLLILNTLQYSPDVALHCITRHGTVFTVGCTEKVSKFLRAHGALVDSNCMEFPNLNFALDWAETKLLNSAYSRNNSIIYAQKQHSSSLSSPGGLGGAGIVTEKEEGGRDMDARDSSFTKLGKGYVHSCVDVLYDVLCCCTMLCCTVLYFNYIIYNGLLWVGCGWDMQP